MPPWTVTDSGRDGVTMAGHSSEAHVGGNRAVHGGMIPLLYDWLLGMTVTAGTITEIDGRKVFITATMTAADGAVLSEANGLMVRLLPHQP